MRRTFYLLALSLLISPIAFGQNGNFEKETRSEMSAMKKGAISKANDRVRISPQQNSALRQGCTGDTIFYEDFSNGLNGANDSGIAWDTTGTYQAWRACGSPCESTNNSTADVGPLQSTTASNGYINLDVSGSAGYIYATGQHPTGGASGPPPVQTMTTSNALDLSGMSQPVLSLETSFGHCCKIDHRILIEFSFDGGQTWPESFDLANNYDRNEYPPNPAVFIYDLSDVISTNPDSVMFRFHWPDGIDQNGQVAGVYQWYLDDVMIKEANRNDLKLNPPTAYVESSSDYFNDANVPCDLGGVDPSHEVEYTMIPRCNFNCLQFGGELCNVGSNTLNTVTLQATVTNANSGNIVYQESSTPIELDSLSCVGSSLAGLPDTTWVSPCMDSSYLQADTGVYNVEYRAIAADSADCDTVDNFGNPEQFRITDRTFAIDDYARIQATQQPVVSPIDQGNELPFTVYNVFEFNWFNYDTDRIEQVCFYLDDTTQVGAGPISVGVAGIVDHINNSNYYGSSEAYFAQQEDIGSWVCLDIKLDSNQNQIPGVSVPTGECAMQVAYFDAAGGSGRIGLAASGQRQEDHAFQWGDFFGTGVNLFTPNNTPMLRVKMDTFSCETEVRPVREYDDGSSKFQLHQNRPNPFTGNSTIRYELEEDARVRFTVRDVTGKLVKRESFGRQSRGEHRIDLNSSKFEAGIYYYTLQVGGERATKKMMVTE